MSDQEERKRVRIDVDKLAAFFERKGIPSLCPVCQNPNWEVPVSTSVGGNTIPWGTGSGDMFMSGMAVVVMVCTRCYFVRQHSLGKRHLGEVMESIPDAHISE